MNYIFPLLIGALIGCSSDANKNSGNQSLSCNTFTLQMLKVKVLGKDINALPKFKCLISKDTLLEGDEGISWKAKAYFYENRIAFLAETNWENSKIIHRITILNSIIKEKELFVGQQLRSIRHLVLNEIPSGPDGYLFLTCKKDNGIRIQFDISEESSDSSLFYGAADINRIPPNVKIESIVIMKSSSNSVDVE